METEIPECRYKVAFSSFVSVPFLKLSSKFKCNKKAVLAHVFHSSIKSRCHKSFYTVFHFKSLRTRANQCNYRRHAEKACCKSESQLCLNFGDLNARDVIIDLPVEDIVSVVSLISDHLTKRLQRRFPQLGESLHSGKMNVDDLEILRRI